MALFALAAALAASAGWIHAKAALAQVLLERAWRTSAHGERAVKPWPWADITPIARLRVPRLGQDEIVLDGDSGQALAFGPGWSPASAAPGTHGLIAISGHRDTQFAFVRELRKDDVVQLEAANGLRRYRIAELRVVDSRTTRIAAAESEDALLLVTCYPFDAIVPGGPLRYVVRADPQPAS
jgi:sortase A